uniref:PPIase cyclophilin-type domain-containing protein n=2 Tax=Meloidogyne TaxID=189290 RepID=A0A915P623_9BILA
MEPVTNNKAAILDEDDVKYSRVTRNGYVRIVTNFGPLNLELFCKHAPRACENFIVHCRNGYYNNTIFHRIVSGFVLQGGDPTGTGTGGESIWDRPFKDEFQGTYKHDQRGILSMANRGTDTNRSQFFITFAACPNLDGKHTVFGRLVGGATTLCAIENVETDKEDRPLEDVKIMAAEVFVDPFEAAAEAVKMERKALSIKANSISSEEETNRNRQQQTEIQKPKSYSSGIDKYIKPEIRIAVRRAANEDTSTIEKLMDGKKQNSSKNEIDEATYNQIATMFQRPSQVEKIDELLKKAERKKAAVEAMLRTGVQSQLEGIRSAISHMQVTAEEVLQIGKSMQEIGEKLQSIPETRNRLSMLSKANSQHSQYAIAVENFKHIFNLVDTVEKTHEYILENKLLHAHKNIMELENARDDLMFEVHKLNSERREYDKNLLKNYFTDLDKLVNDLAKQVWYICSRALEAVQGNDSALQQLVSALRIIEREERIDTYYLDQRPVSNDFMPPGRPRQWRRQLFEVLAKNVRDRLEGNQLEDKAINRQWLARYLEACRRKVVSDLKLVKTCLAACFPPDYNIYDRYIKYYHDSISFQIKNIASSPLEKNELVQLLSWIQAYPGKQMLGDPHLGIQAQSLVQEQPLLPRSTKNHLCDRFIEITRRDMHDWLNKTLIQEKDDWYKHVLPETDNDKHYYTQLPSILFGMVEDTVALSKEISQDIIPRVIDIAVDEFAIFSGKYKDAAMAYKGKHFEDRSLFQHYTATIIAIANNLDICLDSTDKLEKNIRLTMESNGSGGALSPTEQLGDLNGNGSLTTRSTAGGFSVVNRQELIDKMEQLKKKFDVGIQFTISALLEEVLEDIIRHLEQIMTRSWLMGSNDLETICITIADYFNDYKHLRGHIRSMLMRELLFKLVAEFMIGIDVRRLTFNKYEERHLAVERLKTDAKRIQQLFSKFFDDPEFQAIIF